MLTAGDASNIDVQAHRDVLFGRSVEHEVVDAGVADAVARMGRLDFVAANAGMGEGAASFDEMTTETWRRVMAVNLDGVFWTFRAAARHMKERAGKGDAGGSEQELAE